MPRHEADVSLQAQIYENTTKITRTTRKRTYSKTESHAVENGHISIHFSTILIETIFRSHNLTKITTKNI